MEVGETTGEAGSVARLKRVVVGVAIALLGALIVGLAVVYRTVGGFDLLMAVGGGGAFGLFGVYTVYRALTDSEEEIEDW